METIHVITGKQIITLSAVFLFSFFEKSVAQCPNGPCGPNLLPNPNFEITSAACGDPTLSCIMYYDTSKVQGWYGTTLSSGGISQANTPDYSNPFCVGVPFGCNNFGTACWGGGHVWLAESNYEYIQSQLLSPLQAGVTYCFTFTYRLGFNITGFGVWLHNLGKIYHSGQAIFTTQPASINFNTSGGTGCQTATLTYNATGGETWILIGPTFNSQEITLDSLSLREQCLATSISYNYDDISSSIKIFPNPIVNSLNIISETNEDLEIILFDITTRKLLQHKFTSSISLSTEQMAKGVYFYEVWCGTNLYKQGKLVKN